ncbi:MAG: ABC transporter permease, partial [Planctomycetes bacterium]|nr:ABC transporter permease [Planctomycetota bacterium]
WQLHLGLGKDLLLPDEAGREVRLRFGALLGGSVLQDELIVAESHFSKMFPSIGGYGFFLIDTPADSTVELEGVLERELSPFGFDVGLTSARLADYLAVQNTYLSTFQSLGGFGLLLGSVGLAAVLLRNVWERRAELALMRAVGYSRSALGCTVLAENVALLLIGLSTGLVAALVAIAPHIVDRPSTLPWQSVGLTLAAVFTTGIVTGGLATFAALRAPLIPALRAE